MDKLAYEIGYNTAKAILDFFDYFKEEINQLDFFVGVIGVMFSTVLMFRLGTYLLRLIRGNI